MTVIKSRLIKVTTIFSSTLIFRSIFFYCDIMIKYFLRFIFVKKFHICKFVRKITPQDKFWWGRCAANVARHYKRISWIGHDDGTSSLPDWWCENDLLWAWELLLLSSESCFLFLRLLKWRNLLIKLMILKLIRKLLKVIKS